MNKQISHVSVFQTSKIVAILYFVFALIFVPFGFISLLFGAGGRGFAFFMLIAPFIYGTLGFIFVAVACWVYNLVAQRWGGIEVTVTNV